ncbi:MAG: 16S rRNA (adenine(1518)-N(6)/adenine(1519)-N(6))-dimethyltransferase RsmA [Eubacterium sp.]|nr:16S rRNA (adenine(1518)-N(6)/adenine(1519)-N(6))-dimethyltransferase RsmA [Eubacterium sp.]
MKKEPWLAAPSETIRILQKYGFNFQKKYGQNFLIDKRVLEKISKASNISEEDAVIEIGPGIGTLTQYLAYAAGRVYAVEIDRSLIPILDDTLSDWDNVRIIRGDIMELDLKALYEEASGQGRKVRIAANLPYYITTPIMMKLLESRLPFESITVMVQKEVAERMQAEPGGKDYGALSLAVQYYSHPHIDAQVPPNCFIPRPKVGSAVITLDLDFTHRLPEEKEKRLFQVIRAAFAQRRKTLVNSLSHFAEAGFSKEQIAAALKQMGLDERIRGERLSLDRFIELTDRLNGGLPHV